MSGQAFPFTLYKKVQDDSGIVFQIEVTSDDSFKGRLSANKLLVTINGVTTTIDFFNAVYIRKLLSWITSAGGSWNFIGFGHQRTGDAHAVRV